MSEVSSLVSAEHFRYVAEHTVREDAFLADLKRAAVAEGIPSIWVAPEQASYPLFLEDRLPIVRSGGFIMVDNAFAFGQLLAPQPSDREVPAVRAFNEVIAKESRLHSVIVPIGDGLWVGVKN